MSQREIGVRVRRPREGEQDQLGALHNAIWHQTYAGLLPADYLAQRDDASSAARWANVIEGLDAQGRSPDGGVVQVAVRGEQVIGFITVGPGRDPARAGDLELQALYVSPDHHGTGVADQLVHAALVDGPAYLWVLEGNDRAIAYYRKHGFVADGAQKQHPPSGGTEIRMTRAA